MNIEVSVKIDVPSGFYCAKGKRKCNRIGYQADRPYCEIFYPFLEKDSEGNVLRCEPCLLAERDGRLKR